MSCAQCYSCLWNVHSSLPPLIFSIVYYCSVLCCAFNFYFVFVPCLVPNVAHVSGMSIHHCPHWFSLSFITVPCYVVLLIFILSSFHVLCPMLLMSLDCPFMITPLMFSIVYEIVNIMVSAAFPYMIYVVKNDWLILAIFQLYRGVFCHVYSIHMYISIILLFINHLKMGGGH